MSTTRPAAPAFFRPDGDTGHVIERDTERDADREVHPARLTVDLLRPVAMAPLHTRSTVVRRGRRLWLVDAELRQGGSRTDRNRCGSARSRR